MSAEIDRISVSALSRDRTEKESMVTGMASRNLRDRRSFGGRRQRQSIRGSVARSLISWRMLPLIALLAVPPLWTLSKNAIYAYPLSAFGTAMSSPVSVVLPVLAVLLFAHGFSRELTDRHIVNVRLRMDPRAYVLQAVAAAAACAFLYFFVYATVSFVAMVYLLPPSGLLMFDPQGSPPPERFARFSELWSVSPALYGAVYACWCGLNGARWAVVGVEAVLVIRNRLLALLVPMGAVLGLTVGLSLLGADVFAPWPVWILFGYTQSPAWTALVAMALMIGVAAIGITVLVKRIGTAQVAQ